MSNDRTAYSYPPSEGNHGFCSFIERNSTWNRERRRRRRRQLLEGKHVVIRHVALVVVSVAIHLGMSVLTSALPIHPLRARRFTRRHAVVMTPLWLASSTSHISSSSCVTKPLSRPQRKALERAKKQQQLRQSKTASSTILSNWTVSRSDDSRDTDLTFWRRSIQQAQSARNVHRLRQMAQHFQTTNTLPSSIVARLLVALMHCDSGAEEVSTLWSFWQSQRRDQVDVGGRYRDAALLIRTAVSVPTPQVEMAWSILATELPLRPRSDSMTTSPPSGIGDRAHALIAMATWFFRHQQPWPALGTLAVLEETGIVMASSNTSDAPDRTLPWLRLLQEAATCQSWIRQNPNDTHLDRPSSFLPFNGTVAVESAFVIPSVLPSNVVYSVLSAMATFPKAYTVQCDRMYELISNALVRRVVFVTGAVSMAGCPPPDRGEVCFIGRSNVGKSSLINMVFNRKALAYTSKRPGKTQQFNFFTVNDIPAKEQEIKYGDDVSHLGQTKDDDSFTVVDLPGFGYAQVPEAQRRQWLQFMWEYFRTRPNLRVIFHLIDSRHGPMKEDVIIMKQIAGTLQDRGNDVSYVILLTKADKNVKGSRIKTTAPPMTRPSTGSGGKVSKSVLLALQNTMQDCGINRRTTPIVLSSAETRLGRDDIWRYLQRAAEQ
jgi:GTP-binding protein